WTRVRTSSLAARLRVAAHEGEECVFQPAPWNHPVNADTGVHECGHHLGPGCAIDLDHQAFTVRGDRPHAKLVEHGGGSVYIGHIELHGRRVADDVVDLARRDHLALVYHHHVGAGLFDLGQQVARYQHGPAVGGVAAQHLAHLGDLGRV